VTQTTKHTSQPRSREEAADANLVKALSHPLRWQILRMVNEGTSTPAGIARRLGVRTENVSYHVRVLSELGVIELVGTTPVRGALEHHYRATRRAEVSDADSEAMPDEVRRDMVHGIVRQVIEDLIRIGASEQVYTRADIHFSQVPLRVDEEGYSEVVDLLAQTLDRVMEIQAESLARMAGDETGEVRTEVAIMHFPYVPPEV
jgi:DNA-binding transcriptional ArsR family regulator